MNRPYLCGMLWRPELAVWQLRVLLYCGSCGHVLSQAAQRDHKVESRSLTARMPWS